MKGYARSSEKAVFDVGLAGFFSLESNAFMYSSGLDDDKNFLVKCLTIRLETFWLNCISVRQMNYLLKAIISKFGKPDSDLLIIHGIKFNFVL